MSTPDITPPLGGWSPDQLVELADRRTERRGSKTLDLNAEFIHALQSFVTETRWAWRRKSANLTLKAGVWQYDLTKTGSYAAPNSYTSASSYPFTSASYDADGKVTITFPAGNQTSPPGIAAGDYLYLAAPNDTVFDDQPIYITKGTGGNLVSNGDFEDGTTGWTGTDGGTSIVSAPVHGGSQALREISSANVVIKQAVMLLETGVSYTLTGWIFIASYAGSKTISLAVQALQSDGTTVVRTHSALADTTKIGVWQRVTVTFTALSDEPKAYVFFEVNGGVSGALGAVNAVTDDISFLSTLIGAAQTPPGATGSITTEGAVVSENPFTYLTGPDAADFHQMVKHGFHYYPNGQPSNFAEIMPLFERDLQMGAMYSNANGGQPGPPRQYFMQPGKWLMLCIVPVPQQDYPATLDYWAAPNIDPNDGILPDTIPLVPAFLHEVLLKRLEANILRYTLGEGATKYQAAMAEYNILLARYQGMDGMVSGEQSNYSDEDDYESTWATGHNAIQSTR